MVRNDLRNIAIIAHVDHGKTTLVDEMLKQGGAFRENQTVAERVMDSNDLEKERGITILAKNTSVYYKDTKINIIDTPGHADFGGEVERVLNMVDGVLLLVDAAEGPMPQTRFVLSKALEMGHKIIIVVNKIDKPDARLDEIGDEVLELLLDLDANEEQLESPVLFCSGRSGTASLSQYETGKDLTPLFDTILSYIEPPQGEDDQPLQMLISSIDYNEYVGRIGIGRIERGSIKVNQNVTIGDHFDSKKPYNAKIASVYQIQELNRVPVETATVGDIVWISGIENITIGDTICDSTSEFEALPFAKISEPTVEMTFAVNDSPFAGREGKFVTSRQLRARLFKELLKDVSLRVTETENTDSFRVCGRGEMHLSILIENMRREGFELSVSTPHVLFKEIDGRKCEPMELLVIDVPEDCVGSVMEKMGTRKAEMLTMHPQGKRMRLEFKIPARGLFGYKSEFLTDTKGEGIMSSIFEGYEPYKGEIQKRTTGSLVSFETGEAVTYGLYNAQERGSLFIPAGVPVYEGMIVGASPKAEDLVVNVCKKKHLTNTRASGSDDALRLVPPRILSLEDSLEFIADDELLEITPKNIRIRKRILDNSMRAKNRAKK
ncbi:MAG: translational GTPase TypA [Oscillospiraceae bacterium]|nr:translational GTPase TypA [Oscillospiraceae bacterium]